MRNGTGSGPARFFTNHRLPDRSEWLLKTERAALPKVPEHGHFKWRSAGFADDRRLDCVALRRLQARRGLNAWACKDYQTGVVKPQIWFETTLG